MSGRNSRLREFRQERAVLRGLKPDNLARGVVFAVFSVIAAASALLGIEIIAKVWQPHHDKTAAAYIVAGTVLLAAASIPPVFALRIIWDASPGGILVSMLM